MLQHHFFITAANIKLSEIISNNGPLGVAAPDYTAKEGLSQDLAGEKSSLRDHNTYRDNIIHSMGR